MRHAPRLFVTFAVYVLVGLPACRATTPSAEATSETPADAYVVEIVAEDYAFEAPDRIPSGWVTFRMKNDGEETHFLYLSRLPEDRTYDEYMTSVAGAVNEVWQEFRAGEIDKATAGERLGSAIPEWYWTDVEIFGGPGLVAPSGVSQATVNLEPGTYVIECFMKTPEGEFHWVEGMIRPLTVAEEASGATEPEGHLRVRLLTEGYVIEGEPKAGVNRVHVEFAEQPEAGFGNDVHVARLADGVDGVDLVPWMDAFNLDGLENPAPATFVGGTHERPAGGKAYFTIELEPGRYAWISEGPDVHGIVQEFSVE